MERVFRPHIFGNVFSGMPVCESTASDNDVDIYASMRVYAGHDERLPYKRIARSAEHGAQSGFIRRSQERCCVSMSSCLR